jgi:protoheme IX farnesyltransferase
MAPRRGWGLVFQESLLVSDAALNAEAKSAPKPSLSSPRDYLMLMKPRVMSLVVFTAVAGYVAAPGPGDWTLGFATILAIACGAGAAGALNMWFDADIDAKMRRTMGRPVPAGRVAGEEALMLGLVVSGLAVTMMALAGGWLAAALLAFTIAFYALVYTMWLKRRTPHNIVIGGLAGALPPAVAWAAKTGGVTLDPWLLVAIIFLWTPPHFWALCLYQKGDYAAAGVPMLPVAAGPRATRMQILIYAVLLAPLGVAPALTGLGGWVYAVVAGLGGALFVFLSVRVALSRAGEQGAVGAADLYAVAKGDKAARDLFAFSIGYLFLLFAALLVEHGAGLYAPFPFTPLLDMAR